MGSLSAQELITCFESDQRTAVFSALSDYLHFNTFTDVTLCCKEETVRAHKERNKQRNKETKKERKKIEDLFLLNGCCFVSCWF
jgi:hypothetical protein